MKKIYFIVAVLLIVVIFGVMFIFKNKNELIDNETIVINLNDGKVSSSLDAEIFLTKTSEKNVINLILKSKYRGIRTDIFNENLLIILPEGIVLVDGDLNKEFQVNGNEEIKISANLKIERDGDFVIIGCASEKLDVGNDAECEGVYLEVKEGKIFVSDKPRYKETETDGGASRLN